MRIVSLIFACVILASCATPHTRAELEWQPRLSQFAVGDDASSLLSTLEAAHFPVRVIPTLPSGEQHTVYFLHGGEIHVLTKSTDEGKTVILSKPFFVSRDSSVSERLTEADREWDEYVKKHTGH